VEEALKRRWEFLYEFDLERHKEEALGCWYIHEPFYLDEAIYII
jgi:hypothetical protein